MPQISANHLREYETLYILKPEIEDEVAVSFLHKMKDLVEKEGGKHLQVTNWGRKKLAWERDRNQKGMFSCLPLNPGQLRQLEEEYKIYLLPNGRINFAAMTEAHAPGIAEAICAVTNS